MKRTLLTAIAVVLFSAIVLFASGRGPAPAIAKANADGSMNAAPDFALQDLNGKTVRLSDLRGKAVVINFWATWCPPCRHEIPWFVDLQKQYGPQGLEIVGVSMDTTGRAGVAQFAKEMGINYKVVMADSAVDQAYGGIRVLPTTYFIGRDGKILRYAPGMLSRGSLEENVKAALATTRGGGSKG